VVVTPKRAEATCLTALRRMSPLSSALNRASSSPLAGVRLSANPIHRDRERLVRFLADRAE